METKTVSITFRTTPAMKEALKKEAQEKEITVSSLINKKIKQ
jgi:hypothetical protein